MKRKLYNRLCEAKDLLSLIKDAEEESADHRYTLYELENKINDSNNIINKGPSYFITSDDSHEERINELFAPRPPKILSVASVLSCILQIAAVVAFVFLLVSSSGFVNIGPYLFPLLLLSIPFFISINYTKKTLSAVKDIKSDNSEIKAKSKDEDYHALRHSYTHTYIDKIQNEKAAVIGGLFALMVGCAMMLGLQLELSGSQNDSYLPIVVPAVYALAHITGIICYFRRKSPSKAGKREKENLLRRARERDLAYGQEMLQKEIEHKQEIEAEYEWRKPILTQKNEDLEQEIDENYEELEKIGAIYADLDLNTVERLLSYYDTFFVEMRKEPEDIDDLLSFVKVKDGQLASAIAKARFEAQLESDRQKEYSRREQEIRNHYSNVASNLSNQISDLKNEIEKLQG